MQAVTTESYPFENCAYSPQNATAATVILNVNCTHAVAYNNEPNGTAFVVKNITAI